MGALTQGFLAGSNLANPYLGGQTQEERMREAWLNERAQHDAAREAAVAGHSTIYEVNGIYGLEKLMLNSTVGSAFKALAKRMSTRFVTVEKVDVAIGDEDAIIRVFASHGDTEHHFKSESLVVSLPLNAEQKALKMGSHPYAETHAKEAGLNVKTETFKAGSWKNGTETEVTIFNSEELVEFVDQFTARRESVYLSFVTAAEIIVRGMTKKWADHYFAEEERREKAMEAFRRERDARTAASKAAKSNKRSAKQEAENVASWQPEAAPINNPFAALAGLKK